MNDEMWMRMAIALAKRAMSEGERPFGCVIANDDLVSTAYGTGSDLDPTRHSEMVAIRKGCAYLGRNLEGCTLYSTHEPCGMCAGAIVHAHPSRVVWGSARIDLSRLFRERRVKARAVMLDCSRPPEIVEGFLGPECISLFAGEISEKERRIVSSYAQGLVDNGYPEAPEIGGDAYEVADWLRELMSHHAATGDVQAAVAVGDAYHLFKKSNPVVT